MENNENLNNQVNENNNDQSEVVNQTNLVDNSNQQVEKDSQSLIENTPKKSNSGLIALLILIIMGVGGYFAYTKLIAKEEPKGKDNPTPTSNPIVTPGEDSNSTENSINFGTYKTKNGNRTLEILKEEDEVYLAKYNDTELKVSDYKVGKYIVFSSGGDGICADNHFIVNNDTKELLDLDDSAAYYVVQVGEKYFILKGTCTEYNEMYDENLKRIADTFVDTNKKDVLYAMKNGYLNKYDFNGEIIKSGNIKIDNDNGTRLSYPRMYKDNIYSLIEVNKKAYLYDFMNNKKYEIENPYKFRVCPNLYGDECGTHISMDIAGDKLFIQMPPTDKGEWQPDYEDIVYLFDIKSSKLSKEGRYLKSDYNLSTEKSNKGYFYIGNDENVFKYDSNGIVVEKSGFNIKNVYKTLDGKYDVSSYFGYDGKLYYLVKEDSKIYLQNAFSNDKTEIVDLDKYVLLGVRYYLGKGTYAENTGKIEIIVVDKSKDATKTENEIYYYFDMNNNTLTK